jgi:iron complex outermembrane receptor protein
MSSVSIQVTKSGLLTTAARAALMLSACAASAEVTPPPQTGNDAITGSTAADVGASSGGASVAPSDSIAAAQGTAPSPITQPDNGGVQDIVVTAQRRSENLVSVPLSISASTGKALQASGIQSITDLRMNTPGFISASGSGFTQLYIRGIGNGIYVGANPSVATFVDDVPRVYGTLIDDLVNIDRVEVLKGAQGGLYGRNATGGVVNVITKQPGDKAEGQVRFSYGTKKTFKASAYLNLPLNENVAWNVSATRNSHGAYVKNIALKNPYPSNVTFLGLNANSLSNPHKLENQDFWAIDTKLRFRGENFKVTLAADWSKKDDASGVGWHSKDVAGNYQAYIGLLGAFGLGANALPQSLFRPQGKFKGTQAIEAFAPIEDYGASVKAELTLGGADITSVTAFRWNHSQFRGDIGALPVPAAGFQTNFKRRNFYQEVRAVSNTNGQLHWLAGATFYQDHIANFIRGVVLGIPFAPTTSTQKSRDWSIYGQAGYDITDRLTLTGSLRYVEDRKVVNFPAESGLPAATAVAKSHKLIPAATLSYKVNGGTVYARYAKGFKTGGVNPIVNPVLIGNGLPGSVFKPEEVDTYELGYRANLFDRKIQLTTAVFYNKYSNLQISAASFAPGVSQAVINAGKSRSYGAEASVTWRVSKALTLNGNIGYLNAKLTKFSFPGNNIVAPFNFSGNRNPLAPEWQGSAGFNLDQPLNDRIRLLWSGIAAYTSRVYYTSENVNEVAQEGYWLVNTRIGVATTDDHLGAYLFVNNLFNKQYSTAGAGNSTGFTYVQLGTPRIIGGTVEFRF